MKMLFAAASVATLFVAAPALAQVAPAQVYGNVGYSHYGADLDGEDVTLGTIDARLGARFGQYVGVEAEGGLGVKEESIDTGFGDVDIKIKNKLSAYGVGFLPIAPNADLFARIGFGRIELEAEGFGATASDDDTAVSYGAGAQYFFDGMNGVRAEYTRYEFDEGGDIDSLGVSYVRKF